MAAALRSLCVANRIEGVGLGMAALRCLASLIGHGAWVFGLRHAVDADHIAAIDTVVRKLMQEGGRSVAVGFFFSLGHSTIVILASLAIAATSSAMQDRLEAFKEIGSVIGTSISAAIALVNLVLLRGVWRSFRHVGQGGASDA